MKKKIVLGLIAMVAVTGGVAALSAYEAHVINVTAHIENALRVHEEELEFGTVFPQEYLEKTFTVSLSESFQLQDPMRVDDVNYVIKQKPKCECLGNPLDEVECPLGQYASVSYIDDTCPDPEGSAGYAEMLSLCPFLSKLPADEGEPEDDRGVTSYYIPGDPDSCVTRTGNEQARGGLWVDGDLLDLWTVDLKVPPVDGYIGQDWPAGCPTVPTNDLDYGCDLWIEVTGVGEGVCGDGTLDPGEGCEIDDHCQLHPNGSCNPPGGLLSCECKYSILF